VQARVNEELKKSGVDVSQVGKLGESIKAGNTEDVKKGAEDLIGAFGKKKEDKKTVPTTKPAN